MTGISTQPSSIARRSAGAAALLITSLVAAACGSTSSSSGGGGTGNLPSGDIHVGVLSSYTGQFSDTGVSMWEGAKAGEAAVNASGGILGHKLVLDLIDTIGDPADAVTGLNKDIASNHPVGMIGPSTSEIFGIQKILDRNKLPFMFIGGSTVLDTSTDPYFFRANPSDSQLGVAMVAQAVKAGYKKAAIMMSTSEGAQTLKAPVQKAFEANGGTVVANVDLTPGQTSYRSEALKVVNAKPDVIFLQTEPPAAGPLFSNFKELDNLSIPFIGSDLTAGADFIKAVGAPTMSAHVLSVAGSSQPGAGTDAFNQFYQATWHHAVLASANYAYDGVVDLALAITKAGTSDPDPVVAAMPLISNPPGDKMTNYKDAVAAITAGKKINYEGASGSLDFNQTHNVFGPFDVILTNPDATQTVKETFSGDQLINVGQGKPA